MTVYPNNTSLPIMARPETPNGIDSGVQTPSTPSYTGLSLTEYTANPSPPSESVKAKAQAAVPEAFLLPNGYPDVFTT